MSGYQPEPERKREMSRIYFLAHEEAEAYWSMKHLYHNICQSVRTEEDPAKPNENNSYKTKMENALKLKGLWKEIKDMEKQVFKGNTVAVADFNDGKIKQESSSIFDQIKLEQSIKKNGAHSHRS